MFKSKMKYLDELHRKPSGPKTKQRVERATR